MMQKIILFILPAFLTACTLQQSPLSKENANGNIIWASGENEKFYMPESKDTIAFISTYSVIIFKRASYTIDNFCNYYYKETAKIKICDDGEAILFQGKNMINTGFVNLHNNY